MGIESIIFSAVTSQNWVNGAELLKSFSVHVIQWQKSLLPDRHVSVCHGKKVVFYDSFPIITVMFCAFVEANETLTMLQNF